MGPDLLLQLQQMGIQPVIVDRLMFLYYLVAGMLSERLLLRSTLDLGLPKVIAYRLKVSELFSELQLYVSSTDLLSYAWRHTCLSVHIPP